MPKERFPRTPSEKGIREAHVYNMRKYAWLKEPYLTSDHTIVRRIMLYVTGEGVFLFLYSGPNDVQCECTGDGSLCGEEGRPWK